MHGVHSVHVPPTLFLGALPTKVSVEHAHYAHYAQLPKLPKLENYLENSLRGLRLTAFQTQRGVKLGLARGQKPPAGAGAVRTSRP